MLRPLLWLYVRYCTQDKLHLLGWPEISSTGVSERELKSLTGEAVHLGCLGLVLSSVYCDPTAPWWAQTIAPDGASDDKGGAGPAPSEPKKRVRRIGPVKSIT
jgi:hypothetical protein